MGRKVDTRNLGLDAGLEFIHWLTGAENLHYGLWDGLEPTAGNLRQAQDAYTEKLFSFLPKGRLRILDIGGGAGTTAAKLLALGHQVDIVIPSALLAARCRANAPKATVHHCRFEDFQSTEQFNLCLFSESFQYVRLDTGLTKAQSFLSPAGEILIADCFRVAGFQATKTSVVGGGHLFNQFQEELSKHPLEIIQEEDITAAVAPSIDLEQGLFNVIGHALTRVDRELATVRPRSRWALHQALRLFFKERSRFRLNQRLNEKTRSSQVFIANNHYLILRLAQR